MIKWSALKTLINFVLDSGRLVLKVWMLLMPREMRVPKFEDSSTHREKSLKNLRESVKDRREALAIILNMESTEPERSRNELDTNSLRRTQTEKGEAPPWSETALNRTKRSIERFLATKFFRKESAGNMPKRVRTVMKTNVYSTAQLNFLPKTLRLREVQQRNEPIKPVFINPIYKPKMM